MMQDKRKKLSTYIVAGLLAAETLVIASQARADAIPVSNFKPSGYDSIPTDIGTEGRQLYTLAMVVAAVLMLFYMLWGGIEIITAGGDKGKMETGRNKIMFAAIGLIVVASTWAIFRLIVQISYGGFDNISPPKLNG